MTSMADAIDTAQELDQHFRDAALNAALRHSSDEDPLIINGVRCCLECEEPIPQERLKLQPNARRCVGCATKIEKRLRKNT